MTVLVAVTVLAVVVLGAVGVLSVVRAGHGVAARQARAAGDPHPVESAPASPPGAGLATLAAAGASRQQAAAWVAAQVSRGAIVACDPLMCTELHQRGFPAADLFLVSTSSGDPLGSGIVVSTAAVRSQLGSRLATVYAPVVIASFGTGADLVQVRVTVAAPATAYRGQLLAFLRVQRPPLRPLVSLRHHDRTTEVQIKFPAPSPTGLLSAGASP